MSNIPTPHINAKENDFARTVLMPGDPLRSKFIAENFLEDPVLVNNVRGVHGYTGTYQGRKVSVMASGMGCPSIGIYSYELFNYYNVENIIRIGSAGAISPKLKLRDIVVGISAYTDSGYVKSFGIDVNMAPCCSWELLSKAMEQAGKMGIIAYAGPLFSSDTFYSEVKTSAMLGNLGVLAVEMETSRQKRSDNLHDLRQPGHWRSYNCGGTSGRVYQYDETGVIDCMITIPKVQRTHRQKPFQFCVQ